MNKKQKIITSVLGVSAAIAIAAAICLAQSKILPHGLSFLQVMLTIVLLSIGGLFLLKKSNLAYIPSILLALISGAVIFVSIFGFNLQNKVDDILGNNTVTSETIGMYAVSKEYAENKNMGKKIYTSESDCNDAIFTIQDSDNKNLPFVSTTLAEKYGVNDGTRIIYTENMYQSVDNVLDGTADVVLMFDGYVQILKETKQYSSIEKNLVRIGEIKCPIETVVEKENATETQKATQPREIKDTYDECGVYTVCIFGSDTRELDLSQNTRTDVNLVVQVNPKEKKFSIIAIPRDSYINNPYLGGDDKLTHLGVYGIKNSIKGLSDWLDVDIDGYVMVNFETFNKIIDLFDGVDIDNPYEFTTSKDASKTPITYKKGKIHLSSSQALPYVRERYNLDNGDFGRAEHEAIVLEALINKILSKETITKVFDLLDAMDGMFLTNIKSDTIYKYLQMFYNHYSGWSIDTYRIEGDCDDLETASAPGEYLSCVVPYDESVQTAKNMLK